MTRNRLHTSFNRVALITALLAVAPSASTAQVGTVQSADVSREQMWPAPTAEDWARPCLIKWQRTWDDATKVALETGHPILVCVNMDGEIASEHYAGIRYRQPEAAALYEPYITVIASVYRHTPRDYDQEGNRILCPRFGSVTCGEHIAIEPILYEQYFEGERVAPRHVMIELDMEETYDVYYAFDTASVFTTIQKGITERKLPLPPYVRGDRPVLERIGSSDITDLIAVETAYKKGDRQARRNLIAKASDLGGAAPIDLLRLALFGLDIELARMARATLAQATAPEAIDLINEALRVPMNSDEREALILALERLGADSPRAKTFAVVHRGLATRSDSVDVAEWAAALEEADSVVEAADWSVLESRLESQYEVSRSRAEDAAANLELAEASLALAVDPNTADVLGSDPKTQSKYARLMFEDAQVAARKAEELGAGEGASAWRVNAVLALTAYYLGDFREAHRYAAGAARAIPSGDTSWNAMAVLSLFAQGRQRMIRRAALAREEWPAEWLTDVNAAYSVLARHPLGTDYQVVAHYDFLKDLRAGGQAARVLEEGLARFPESWMLHGRLRARLLEERGVDALETAYETMLRAEGAAPNLPWFAGLASIVAAEYHRRAGNDDRAVAAYDRSVQLYDIGIEANPESRDSADHYAAIAIAGRARVALERGDLDRALSEVLASFERRPASAGSLDGLNFSAVVTAKTLLARLDEAGRPDAVVRLRGALDQLDPEVLKPPAFENPAGRPTFQSRGDRSRARAGR